ncbi:MAG: HlyD family efflux transporter periplasmic adaptor subunit [Janthinobacterium lividum]
MMHDVVRRSDELPVARPGLWRRLRRPLLLVALPLLVLAGGIYLWLTGGESVSTDNAYVQQDKVSISADISGRVVDVDVGESQQVRRGQTLYRIDPEPFRIALAQADAALASARLQVAQLRSTFSGKGADVVGKREAIDYAEIDLKRQNDLLKAGFTTNARQQQAEHALAQAKSEFESAVADEANARAALSGAPAGAIDRHPLVLAALAARDKAALDLRRTTVIAPVDGLATQTTKVQTGQIAITGLPTMSVLVSNRVWVEANFKETDLEHMRVGEPATVKLDAYPGTPLKGHVLSIGGGTGSEFSVLPAQNATGNWVKITQRVPVRIEVDDRAGLPMIAGLSAKVTVDLRNHGR